MPVDHVDLLIIGAGLSGIGAGHQMHKTFPKKTYRILEQRSELGGTWSLFKYPGIRSDSDMHTLGYRFKPWTAQKAIADGPSILEYVRETAREGDVLKHIVYNQKAIKAEWSTDDAQWTVTSENVETGEQLVTTARYLLSASGYYSYDNPYRPEFAGEEKFTGQIIHPQHWPDDLDYAGKKVVVIGSGATAVTLVPAMAEKASHVTMLQRTPTYIVALPGEDKLANGLRKVLPIKAAYAITRWKNVARILFSFQLSRRRPEFMKRMLRKMTVPRLPKGFDYDTHLTPPYNPWDQRMCLVPDGDLFTALHKHTVDIVTDHIETFTENGIKLKSGDELEADIVVTATGLSLLAFGGVDLVVDGKPVELPETMAYKGIMLSDVPNFWIAIGYTNASWTLKVDLTYDYMWRLIKRLDATGMRQCTPRGHESVEALPFLDFTSGYVLRSVDQFPKRGAARPWRLAMNYAIDVMELRYASIDDSAMEFSNPARTGAAAATAGVAKAG